MSKEIGKHDEEILKLFSTASYLAQEIGELQQRKSEVFAKAAQLSCPYKVGDIVVTDSGLGKGGLKIIEIRSPKFPSYNDNMWEVATQALSKAGEVTNRIVSVTQDRAKYENMRLR